MRTIFKLFLAFLFLPLIFTQMTCPTTQYLLPVADDALGTNLNLQCLLIRHYLPNCKYYRRYDVAATTTPVVAAYTYFGCYKCEDNTGVPTQVFLNQVPRSTSGTTSSVPKTCYSTNQKVDSCTAYRVSRPIGSSSIYECVACLGTHTLANFINGNITCTIRVTNCVMYVQSQAQAGTFRCSACSPSGANPRTPIYNTDGITTRCVLTSSIAVISNCADYQETTTGGNVFRCKTCNTNFLLATFIGPVYTPAGTNLGTACINPIVPNCLTYYYNGVNYFCRTCSASFILIYTSSGALSSIEPIQTTECVVSVLNCQIFNTTAKFCQSCGSKTLIYSSNGALATSIPIQATECVVSVLNCQIFNTSSKFCQSCGSKTLIYSSNGALANYIPTQATECVFSVLNCLVFDTTTKFCKLCYLKALIYTSTGALATGSPIYESTKCVSEVLNCHIYYQNGANYYCKTCGAYFTLIYTSSGVIVSGLPIQTTQCASNLVQNCLSYHPTTKQCLKCDPLFPNYVRIKQPPFHSCIAVSAKISSCAVYTTPSLACHCYLTPLIQNVICGRASLKCKMPDQYTDQCP